MARNKGLTRIILEKEEIQFPKGKFFSLDMDKYSNYSIDDLSDEIINYANKIKFPIMIKGADLHRGVCVNKIDSTKELLTILPKVWAMTSGLIIEEYKFLLDYRFIILDDEIIVAYGKTPFAIVGDGIRSGEILVDEAKMQNSKVSIGTGLDDMNNKIYSNLKKAGYTKKAVIPKGETIILLEVCNVSTGGTPWDCTKLINKNFHDYCRKIMKALNLRFAGIDILSPDISSDPKLSYLLEVNSSPDLEGYAKLGSLQKGKIQKLMENILIEMMKI